MSEESFIGAIMDIMDSSDDEEGGRLLSSESEASVDYNDLGADYEGSDSGSGSGSESLGIQ